MEVTPQETGGYAGAGFGAEGKPFFWIGAGSKPNGGVHIAFTARTRDEVDAFYRAAIAAGGKDNGAPGPRPHYHAHYYGAFVFDPDGNNIEAVCHRPG
jgi:predicted lactoylglutathione lyase